VASPSPCLCIPRNPLYPCPCLSPLLGSLVSIAALDGLREASRGRARQSESSCSGDAKRMGQVVHVVQCQAWIGLHLMGLDWVESLRIELSQIVGETTTVLFQDLLLLFCTLFCYSALCSGFCYTLLLLFCILLLRVCLFFIPAQLSNSRNQ
jgi:hypothetical protein